MFKLDGPTLRRAILHYFESGTLAKGTVYERQHRVVQCTVKGGTAEDWIVFAEVLGSRREPYEVNVHLFDDSLEELGITSLCSCPERVRCKHAAAALLHVAEQPGNWARTGLAGFGPYQDLLFPDFTPPPSAPQPEINPRLKHWLEQLGAATLASEATPGHAEETEPEKSLLYLLRPEGTKVRVEFCVARPLRYGGYTQGTDCHVQSVLYRSPPPPFVRPEDLKLIRKLALCQFDFGSYLLTLEAEWGVEILREMLATGRCHWRGAGKKHRGLVLGLARQAEAAWEPDARGVQHSIFRIEPPVTEILQLSPLWYVDETRGECGPIETSLSAPAALIWLRAPAVAPEESPLVVAEFQEASQRGVVLPPPHQVDVAEWSNARPSPRLRLYAARLLKKHHGYGWAAGRAEDRATQVNFAKLEFDYGGVRVEPHVWRPLLENYADGKLQRIRRDAAKEKEAVDTLHQAGLQPANRVVMDATLGTHMHAMAYRDESRWLSFVDKSVPKLRAIGWRVKIEDSFQYRLVEPEDWFMDAASENDSHGWFGLELGVVVDGEKINLLPVLLNFLQAQPRFLEAGHLDQMPDEAVIPVPLADGRKVPFPAARARQVLGVLLELLNPDSLNDRGQLRLSKLRTAELAGEADWRWLGTAELRELCDRLRHFNGISPVATPADLRATLRPYQQEGLNWLQFLREYELGGVLADDMGLGKTVQALANLLVEKAAGRLDRPSLVVAPTSLMTNWRQETERFAPGLRVLVLHGFDRKQHFDRIAGHDLVVTSYSLLPRDRETLLGHEFHYVILDEAQFIKNPKTLYAQVACSLKARHRLCLTGTPMENHLGELWSLFHFLLPGFLGDQIRFQSTFRRPIEKGKVEDRRKLLARRVGPFILRRKKEQVVTELPSKTVIVQNVELSGAQRDLYESVRLAMHHRVKEEVDKKGLSRAHIIILDALLKLRQICCHPQLLQLPAARRVNDSAKLDLLLDLVPEMVEEGRRILLFSQFTSMLAIIEKELTRLKLPYLLLTGATRDRATPVQRFQNGEAPVFLISLKAGGTGLNLTAADTVIHYDPWWNPAVENQATDRAHRIGQEKKVFVYRLMTVGTVEEKINALQARKRELVEGLLNEERPDNLNLSAEDLDVLFAPLG